jgi:sarcosine oxidase
VSNTFDVIVVGLGAMGSAALYQLSKRGKRVLGLDMYPLGHDLGSSHGHHRLIRRSSFGPDNYVALAERSFEIWRDLEEQSGRELLKILGEVRLVAPDGVMSHRRAQHAHLQSPFTELLDEEQLAERFPGFRLYDGMFATYEAEAGFLRPEAGIEVQLDFAQRAGAEVRRPEEVMSWARDGDGVRVQTAADTYTADRLVVTTGPWAEELLDDLGVPLQVTRIVNAYFEPERPDLWTAENGAPDFLLSVPEGGMYGMPSIDGIGLKIGKHQGVPIESARTIKREIDQSEVDFLGDVLDRYMPGASGRVQAAITCMYTNTTDDDFIVDRHPLHEQVMIGCGFCGRGYKFSVVVGEIMADLAIDGRTEHDIEFLSAKRPGLVVEGHA